MKKTLLVGDLHLEAQIILPMVEQQIGRLKVNQVILLGDYVDAYGQTNNTKLYINELDFLLFWKAKMQAQGINVITLLGNHDAPYLILSPRSYSLVDTYGFMEVHEKLLSLGLQVAFQLGEYLVSHAGYTEAYDAIGWHFKILEKSNLDWKYSMLSKSDTEKIMLLESQVGFGRGGGSYKLGGPIWADYQRELIHFPNNAYSKQIVGHTPQKKIVINDLTGIDTFTVIPTQVKPFIKLKGSGEVLLFEDNTLSTIQLKWDNETARQIEVCFKGI